VARLGEFPVNVDPKIVDILELGDGKGAIRVAEVKVHKWGTMGAGCPLYIVKGDELHLIMVNAEAVSGKPAHHVLKALGS
jgi:hypothetical protein